MFGLTVFGDVIVFFGGVAVGVLFKDPVLKFVMGAVAFEKMLEKKIADLKAKL